MNGYSKTAWFRYGSAAGNVAWVTHVCLILDPILEVHLFYLWFFTAIRAHQGRTDHAGFRCVSIHLTGLSRNQVARIRV